MYYRSCIGQALLALENYPHLLLLHLDANYPTEKWNMGQVTALLNGSNSGWAQKSMLVTAWQSAGPALDVSTLSAEAGFEQLANLLRRRFTLKRRMPL